MLVGLRASLWVPLVWKAEKSWLAVLLELLLELVAAADEPEPP